MQTHRNKEVTSSLFPSNSIKDEEAISMCAVKRDIVPRDEMCHPASSPGKRPLIDSRHEISTPHMKRSKQEDEACFWEDKESISLSSKTSLQSIISEVAHSFENNADIYESIPTSQGNKKSRLDHVNRNFSTVKDTVVFQHKDRERICSPQIAEDGNEVATECESHKASMPSVDIGKKEISVLSIADQLEAETTKPILRTIKCSDSGKSEGFAYDHNFFPKLVGVHSISSPPSSSTETGFQMKTQCSPPVLEQPREHQNINAEETVDVYGLKPCASSRTNEIPRDACSQSSSNNQSKEECDLLFNFTQHDGKNDLFLVIKDEVFSVKRFDYKGESYLIHTDNKGKTSILAKAPKEGKGGSQDSGNKSEATRQSVSNNLSRSTHVSTIVSALSRQTLLQRTPSHPPAPPPSSTPALQSSYDRMAYLCAQETPPATCGQHQLEYDNTRMLRRLLSNGGQRAEPSGLRTQLPAGQQRFRSQARADRHQVVTNDSLQNSTTIAISAPPQASTVLNTSTNILRNQHLMITNQDSAAINQPIHNATNEFSQQQHTNTTVQGPYGGHNAASSGKQRCHREEIIEVDNYRKPTFAGLSSRSASEINESRIEKRKELMRYITNHLASSGNQAPSQSNSSELINLVTKGREVRSRQPYAENVTKGNGSSNSRYHEMAGLRQHRDNDTSLPPSHSEGHSTSSRGASGVGTNIGVCDVGQRYYPRQGVGQNSADLLSQPQSDVSHLNVDHLQGSLQSNSETEGNSKVLQIIESWKRRQQSVSSSNTFRQLRELLTRVDGSADSSRNTCSSIKEKILNRLSQVAHPSDVARDTPVISQISYGAINRSTDGENVTPKRTATALVIDQQHSIYVDATDSVMDERRTAVNPGQQFSNTGDHLSGRSYQSEKAATSFLVSSDSTVGSWLQETGRPVNSITTSGQRPYFSSKLPQKTGAFSDQRFYKFEMLPRKTAPKVDKRCVANNTLNPVPIIPSQIIRLPHERNFVTSLVCSNKVPVQASPSPSEVTKPCEVPSYGVSDVAGPSEAAKLCQFVKPREAAIANGKTGTVDVVEIIDSPPTQGSLPSPTTDSENNEASYKTVSGQRSCVNDVPSSSTAHNTKLCHAEKSETDDVVEITNSPLKGDSIDHMTVNKNSFNSQSEEDEQTRINALRAELMRKIRNTNDRIAQENIDWKKKYLIRLKTALTKKLAKLPPCVTDVTVIDDD